MNKQLLNSLFVGAKITSIDFKETIYGIEIAEVYVTLTDGTETSLYGTAVESIWSDTLDSIED